MLQASYDAMLVMEPRLPVKETCLWAQQFYPENRPRNASLGKVACLMALVRNKCEEPQIPLEDTVYTSKYDTLCKIQSVQETIGLHLGLQTSEQIQQKIDEVEAAKKFLVKITTMTDKNLFHQSFVQASVCSLNDLLVHLEHHQGEGRQGQEYKFAD